MQTNFFATTDDWVNLWTWIMEMPGMRAIEHYSRPDQPNRDFPTIASIEAAIREGDYAMAAWPSSVGGKPRTQRIDFEPNTARSIGAKGRWVAHSPALITFMRHNEQRRGCLSPSYFTSWSEAGARQTSILPEEILNEVDWKAFSSVTRGIARKIRAESPAKLGGATILPDAMRRLVAGEHKLWGWGKEVDASSPQIIRLR